MPFDEQHIDEHHECRREIEELRDIIDRIALDYPVVAGPNECPPAPHACSKCEIYHLLDEYADDRREQNARITDTICDSVKELLK